MQFSVLKHTINKSPTVNDLSISLNIVVECTKKHNWRQKLAPTSQLHRQLASLVYSRRYQLSIMTDPEYSSSRTQYTQNAALVAVAVAVVT